MGLTNDLRFRVDLYGSESKTNEMGEDDIRYKKIKTVWAGIKVTSGAERSAPDGSVFAEVTHKITLRTEAAEGITPDMYFIYKNQRYNIKYMYPHYKYRDRVEFYCKLEVGK